MYMFNAAAIILWQVATGKGYKWQARHITVIWGCKCNIQNEAHFSNASLVDKFFSFGNLRLSNLEQMHIAHCSKLFLKCKGVKCYMSTRLYWQIWRYSWSWYLLSCKIYWWMCTTVFNYSWLLCIWIFIL